MIIPVEVLYPELTKRLKENDANWDFSTIELLEAIHMLGAELKDYKILPKEVGEPYARALEIVSNNIKEYKREVARKEALAKIKALNLTDLELSAIGLKGVI